MTGITGSQTDAPRCSCGRNAYRFGVWTDDDVPTKQRPSGWCDGCGERLAPDGVHLPATYTETRGEQRR